MNAIEDRETHLTEFAKFWATGGEKDVANRITRMKFREQQARLHKICKIVKGKTSCGAIQSISVPEETDTGKVKYRQIFDPVVLFLAN